MSGCDYCFGNRCNPCTEAMGLQEKADNLKSLEDKDEKRVESS